MTTFILTNKNREKASIVMLVSFMGKKYKKSIGCSIPDKLWSDTKKRVKITTSSREYTYINDIIDKWEEAAEKASTFFRDSIEPPSPTEMFDKINEFRFGVDLTKRTSVAEYLSIYMERYKAVRSLSRMKTYRQTHNLLLKYQEHIDKVLYFEDLNISFYTKFTEWFYGIGYSANYYGTIIKVLKLISSEARDVDHIHSSFDIKNKGFIAPKSDVDNIYLTEDELESIYHFQFTDEIITQFYNLRLSFEIERKIKTLDTARKMFLIGAYTGLRFSDFSQIKEKNIYNNTIVIQTQKTKTKVVIPIHWIVKEIIDSGYDFDFVMHPQKLNNHIKDIARMVGINEKVIVRRNVAGTDIEISKHKYELVCTHTARRSFATNAYKAGIPTIAIMKITGHKSEHSFLKYLKITEEENAEILKNHPFFKQ